jgi:glucose uptake protein
MVLIQNYGLAIAFCILAMICWGSWANAQKIASKTWRFELFYWDMVLGILFVGLLSAFTVGSMGSEGRTFMNDLKTADAQSIVYAMLGGALWNLGNLLLVAAISVAGMAIAFPIGGGIAWILGTIVNYFIIVMAGGTPSLKPFMLWIGVAIIISAIYLSSLIYKRIAKTRNVASTKGIILSVVAGLVIAFFYGFVVKSIDPAFVSGSTGTLTPYTALFFFTMGVLVSTFIINPIFMAKPVTGEPVRMKAYFNGTVKEHLSGILGGMIWCMGMVVSFMAVGAANPAIAYALSNAAPVVAMLWGIFVWKEFKDADQKTKKFLLTMFTFYIIGLVLITFSNI